MHDDKYTSFALLTHITFHFHQSGPVLTNDMACRRSDCVLADERTLFIKSNADRPIESIMSAFIYLIILLPKTNPINEFLKTSVRIKHVHSLIVKAGFVSYVSHMFTSWVPVSEQ